LVRIQIRYMRTSSWYLCTRFYLWTDRKEICVHIWHPLCVTSILCNKPTDTHIHTHSHTRTNIQKHKYIDTHLHTLIWFWLYVFEMHHITTNNDSHVLTTPWPSNISISLNQQVQNTDTVLMSNYDCNVEDEVYENQCQQRVPKLRLMLFQNLAYIMYSAIRAIDRNSKQKYHALPHHKFRGAQSAQFQIIFQKFYMHFLI
jgi:hypothetical protein